MRHDTPSYDDRSGRDFRDDCRPTCAARRAPHHECVCAELDEIVTEMFGRRDCGLCGEAFVPRDEVAEMYDPANPGAPSVICHGQCGLDAGLDLA